LQLVVLLHFLFYLEYLVHDTYQLSLLRIQAVKI
jgi:hypothetical protein